MESPLQLNHLVQEGRGKPKEEWDRTFTIGKRRWERTLLHLFRYDLTDCKQRSILIIHDRSLLNQPYTLCLSLNLTEERVTELAVVELLLFILLQSFTQGKRKANDPQSSTFSYLSLSVKEMNDPSLLYLFYSERKKKGESIPFLAATEPIDSNTR